jgi:hypothetical protein
MIGEIGVMQQRMEAARGLADLLAAAWDAFTMLLAACEAGEEQSAELSAAFAFAAAAAAQGRLALAAAPSLPPAGADGASLGPFVHDDPGGTADVLAELAVSLREALANAGLTADDAGDRAACADAAAGAAQVFELLAPGGP